MNVSFLTGDLIPDSYTELYSVEAQIEFKDAAGAVSAARFRYQYTVKYYAWLPFFLAYPDFLMGLNGGKSSNSPSRQGRRQVIRRLAYDVGTVQKSTRTQPPIRPEPCQPFPSAKD